MDNMSEKQDRLFKISQQYSRKCHFQIDSILEIVLPPFTCNKEQEIFLKKKIDKSQKINKILKQDKNNKDKISRDY